jgi:branched-chain amino acid transport system ATP-binding protein
VNETARLEVAEMTVRFGGLTALDRVTLRIPSGGLVGLIGPNGAGKTTLIDALTGFVRGRGHVRLDGRPIEHTGAHRRARLGLARTFQSIELFEDLTVYENMLVAAQDRGHSGVLDPLRGIGSSIQSRITRGLDRVGILGLRDYYPGELSLADRKLAGLARALVTEPRVLLLDEPAAGLGRDAGDRLGLVLRGLADRGTALLLVDHDMRLVLGICDWVYVLDLGSVIAEGSPSSVRADPRVISAYLGEDEASARVDIGNGVS